MRNAFSRDLRHQIGPSHFDYDKSWHLGEEAIFVMNHWGSSLELKASEVVHLTLYQACLPFSRFSRECSNYSIVR